MSSPASQSRYSRSGRFIPVSFVPAQEHNVDIGVRVQFSPAVAAYCQKGRHGARCLELCMSIPQNPVYESGPPLHHLTAGSAGKVRLPDDRVFFRNDGLESAGGVRDSCFTEFTIKTRRKRKAYQKQQRNLCFGGSVI